MHTCPNCGYRAPLAPLPDTLTPRQHAIMRVIQQHIAERGYPPSVRGLGALLGLRSSATVYAHLRALERRGCVAWAGGQKRALRVLVGDGKEKAPPGTEERR